MRFPFALILLIPFFTGCATTDEGEPNRQATGTLIGAVVGGLLGAQVDDDDGNNRDGILIGAVAGAAAGNAIGAHMDRQQAEFEEQLAAEQAANEIEIQRVREDLLQITFDNEVTFDYDSAAVKENFRDSLGKVANVLVKYDSQATVVGHTDSTGSEAYNQSLSERRADEVRSYLVSRGVTASQIEAYGRGEMQPRSSNETETGRQLNRRVEVFVRPGQQVSAN